MTVSLGFVGSDQAVLQKSIEQSENQIETLETEVQAVEDASARLITAQKISDGSISFSELIPSIGAVLPQGVVLNALSLTGGTDDPLKLDVDLVSAELASVLIRNLVESELFEAADISSLSPKGSADVDGTETAESKYRYGASVTASFVKDKNANKQPSAEPAP